MFNNTIFVAGCTYNSSTMNEDIFVLCMSSDGDILWVSTWDSGHRDLIIHDYWSAYRSLYVCDKGVFVVGTVADSMGSSIVVLNFDFSGKLVWYAAWKTTHDVAGRSIFVYDDRIFVLGTSRGDRRYPILLVYHLNGSLIISHEYADLPILGGSIWVYRDKIYICGYSKGKKEETVVLRLSPNGTIEQTFSLRGDRRYSALDMVIYGDHIYIVGNTEDGTDITPAPSIFVLKLDLDGNIVWDAVIDEDTRGNPKIAVCDSEIYVSGRIIGEKPGLGDVFVMKLAIDNDLDGVSDAEERSLGTSPSDADTDGDLFWDGTERYILSDPRDPKMPLIYIICIITPPIANILACISGKRVDESTNIEDLKPIKS